MGGGRRRRGGEELEGLGGSERGGTAHHDGEDDADLLNNFEDTEHSQEHHLDQRVRMDPAVGNVPQVLIVRFVLVWHQQQEKTLHKLYKRGGGRGEKRREGRRGGRGGGEREGRERGRGEGMRGEHQTCYEL